MNKSDEHLNSAPAPVEQIKSSQATMAWGGIIGSTVLSYLCYLVAYSTLPEAAAQSFISYCVPAILAGGVGISLTGGVGTSIRGLWLTKDRIEKKASTQEAVKPLQVPSELTYDHLNNPIRITSSETRGGVVHMTAQPLEPAYIDQTPRGPVLESE